MTSGHAVEPNLRSRVDKVGDVFQYVGKFLVAINIFPKTQKATFSVNLAGTGAVLPPLTRPGVPLFSLARVATLSTRAVRAAHRCIWHRTKESEGLSLTPNRPASIHYRHTTFFLSLAVSKFEGPLLEISPLIVTGTCADTDSRGEPIGQEHQQQEPQPQMATTPSKNT